MYCSGVVCIKKILMGEADSMIPDTREACETIHATNL